MRPFFEAVERGDIHVLTSTLPLTEVLVHPFKYKNQVLALHYSRILLHSRNVTTLAATAAIAEEAAWIRAAYGLKTPDSIQIATALSGKATTFRTNYERFSTVPGLQIVHLDSLQPAS